MATGLLYDVHGNLPALEAVLADAVETPVSRWVLGGDYASFGAWPVEVVSGWTRSTTPSGSAATGIAGRPATARTCRPSAALQTAPRRRRRLGPDSSHGWPRCPPRTATATCFLPRRAEQRHGLVPADPWATTRGCWAASGRPRRLRPHASGGRRATRARHLLNPGSVGLPFDGDTASELGGAARRRLRSRSAASPTTSTRRSADCARFSGPSVAGRNRSAAHGKLHG